MVLNKSSRGGGRGVDFMGSEDRLYLFVFSVAVVLFWSDERLFTTRRLNACTHSRSLSFSSSSCLSYLSSRLSMTFVMAMSPLRHPSPHIRITGRFLSVHPGIGSITAYASVVPLYAFCT